MAGTPANYTAADRVVAWFSPAAAVRRAHARSVLAAYEAAKPDRLRKGRRETGSGNAAVLRAGATLRQTARHLEQNYDLALGVLNTLVANVVGAHGIGVEPQPRKADGTIDDLFAREILELYKAWSLSPEVTRQHDWASAQRLICRTWLRDGEEFTQMIAGPAVGVGHTSRVPFSIEMLEADFVPMELNATAPARIVQGIEINAWGAASGFHVFKTDPTDGGSMIGVAGNTKRVPADRMLHIKNVHRIRQMRGVSVFASVLNRFDDLKDYEESERIAAKIAASMAAYIRKGDPKLYEPETDGEPRSMKMRPGMIFDDLRPGEEIGMIDTNRPNPNLETYRNGQLKAIGAGAGPTFSSIARTYDGTYSAQRQELVEGYAIYATLSSEFIGRIVRPVYEQFVAVAVASGVLKVPAGTRMDSVDDAAYMPPSMPWIDPRKEAEAWGMLEDRCYASGPEIIRKRGGNPIDTLEQQARWRREKADNDIPVNAAQEVAQEAQPEAEARAALADAQARYWEAQQAAENVRTARGEAVAEAHVALAREQVRLVQAEIDERAAKQKAAGAEAQKLDAEAALKTAEAQSLQAKAAAEAAEAQARMELAGAEASARITALQEQAQQAKDAATSAADALQAAEARAQTLHDIASQAERDRSRIAAIDLEAAQLALRELRTGDA